MGFEEVIEVARSEMAAAITPAEPLSYSLPDDLWVVNTDGAREVLYPSGSHRLNAVAAAEIYAFRNDGETDANRLERQRALWESWLDSLGGADDPGTAVLPFQTGLSPFLRALGAGATTVEVAPLQLVASP